MVAGAIADLERSAWRCADAASRKRHDGVALVVDRDPEVETRTVGIDCDPGPAERVDEGPATVEIGLLGMAYGSVGGRIGEEAEQDSLEEPRGPGRAELATPDDGVDDLGRPTDGGEPKVGPMRF